MCQEAAEMGAKPNVRTQAQRPMSANLVAQGCQLAAPHQVGSHLGHTGHQINVALRQPVAHAVHPRQTVPH